MSTLDTNNKAPVLKRKLKLLSYKPFTLVLLAVLCIGVDNIYAIFGHGVRSPYMSFMFLYPLGGAVVYFLLGRLLSGYAAGCFGRFGVNLFNSGIATLTLGSFLVGILEIAGSSSTFTPFFFIGGWLLSGIGFLALVYFGVRKK